MAQRFEDLIFRGSPEGVFRSSTVIGDYTLSVIKEPEKRLYEAAVFSGNVKASSGSLITALSSTVGAGQLSVVGAGQVTADSSALFSGNITAAGATTMPGAATLNIVGTILWEDNALSSKTYTDTNLASNSYSDVNLTDNTWEAA